MRFRMLCMFIGFAILSTACNRQAVNPVATADINSFTPTLQLPSTDALVVGDSLFPTPTVATAPAQSIQVSVAVTTNVRTGPSTSYQVAGQISPAAMVDVVGTNEAGDWLQIRFPDAKGGLGWVFASLTDFAAGARDLPVIKEFPSTENLAGAGDGTQTSVTFSDLAVDPDNTLFAVVGNQGAQLYSLVTYEFVRSLDVQGFLAGAAAWSEDGKQLAVGLHSQDETAQRIQLWDTVDWRLVDQSDFQGYGRVSRMRWSPDGQRLAVGCDFGLLVWSPGEKRVIDAQKEFAATVSGIAWSSESDRLVATPDLAYGIRMWRLDNPASTVRLFDQRASSAGAVDWSLDGAEIAVAHSNNLVVLWDEDTKQPRLFIPQDGYVYDLGYSPNGEYLAAAGDMLTIWDPLEGKKLKEMKRADGGRAMRMAWIKAGDELLALYDTNRIGVWNVADGFLVKDIFLTAR